MIARCVFERGFDLSQALILADFNRCGHGSFFLAGLGFCVCFGFIENQNQTVVYALITLAARGRGTELKEKHPAVDLGFK